MSTAVSRAQARPEGNGSLPEALSDHKTLGPTFKMTLKVGGAGMMQARGVRGWAMRASEPLHDPHMAAHSRMALLVSAAMPHRTLPNAPPGAA